MHLLDLLMYFVSIVVFWKLLAIVSDEQFTEELGGVLVGLPLVFLLTIAYIIVFAIYPDWNWIDIFRKISIQW